MLRRSSNCNRNDEAGIYVLLLVFSAFVLMALAWIGAGLANVLSTKHRLQNVVDAAVASAMEDARNASSPDDVIDTANRLLRDNLQANGFFFTPDPVVPEYYGIGSGVLKSLSATAGVHVPLTLLGVVPGFPDSLRVDVAAKATQPVVIITLVLDISGSMGTAKLAALKAAANTFVDKFADNRDYFAIVTYNSTASVLHEMQLLSRTIVKQKINGLTSGGSTNIQDALVLARQENNRISLAESYKAIILFTDGTPNMGNTGPLPTNTLRSPVESCDYSQTSNLPRHILRTIMRADEARQPDALGKRAVVYAIGLGDNCQDFLDPYQRNCVFPRDLHSHFLSRIANDSHFLFDTDNDGSFADEDIDADSIPDDPADERTVPDFHERCVPTFEQLENAGEPKGEYFETPDAAELGGFFDEIAARIKPYLTDPS